MVRDVSVKKIPLFGRDCGPLAGAESQVVHRIYTHDAQRVGISKNAAYVFPALSATAALIISARSSERLMF
jgi:hypothetical protein